MALQIRRGLAANLPASPADGELLYATDTIIGEASIRIENGRSNKAMFFHTRS